MANRSLKKPTAFRLTEDAVELLRLLQEKTGVSQTGIVELSIREKAEREGVSLPKLERSEPSS